MINFNLLYALARLIAHLLLRRAIMSASEGNFLKAGNLGDDSPSAVAAQRGRVDSSSMREAPPSVSARKALM